jgi:hypothetical protein
VSNRGKTTILQLDGSRTFNPNTAQNTKQLTYEWVLRRRFGNTRGISLTEAVNGDTITYTWYNASKVGPQYVDNVARALPIVYKSNALTDAYFPTYNRNALSPLHTLKSPRTSGFTRITTNVTLEDECTVTERVTSLYSYQSSPLCSVTINHYTSELAQFQADSYVNCLGDYQLELNVRDGCTNVVDTYSPFPFSVARTKPLWAALLRTVARR